MLKRFRPYAEADRLAQYGTDVDLDGRFLETLTYNKFEKKDDAHVKEIGELISPTTDEAVEVFSSYLTYLLADKQRISMDKEIEQYLHTFFNEKRDEAYPDKVISFFTALRNENFNIGKLIVVFNQMNFFFCTVLLSKKGLTPNKCLNLMESLQRATNIDQQILIEVFTEKTMEQAAIGISGLMSKNAEIMFVKDLLLKLEDQDVEIQSVTAAGEQLSASIDEVARNTTSVAEAATETVEKSEEGKTVIERALSEIVHTQQQFAEVLTKEEELRASVENIENVINIIKGIADQTNLLALNASIEAARAGEAGQGFAVVASEVRKLAETTVANVQSITENVESLQEIANDISVLTNETNEVVESGVKEAQVAVPLLNEIMQRMTEVSDATSNNAAVSEEQASAINEVASRMVSITELTNDIQQLGEQTGTAIYELSKMTEEYRTDIFSENIHLSTRSLLELAKTDHILWKWRIYNMLIGLETIRPEDVSSHKACRFGKWYFDPATIERVGGSEVYEKIDPPHEQVHDLAKQAVEAYANDEIEKAEALLVQLEEASDEVLHYIDELIVELGI